MEYITYGIGIVGALLVASSFVDTKAIQEWLAKKKQPVVAELDPSNLLADYTAIRALLVQKLGPDIVAKVDKVVLDQVTGGAKDEQQ